MSYLPVISAREVIRALLAIGYQLDHQRGSHVVLRHTDPPHRRVTVPNHDPIAKGTLRSIIRETGLTVDEFRDLL